MTFHSTEPFAPATWVVLLNIFPKRKEVNIPAPTFLEYEGILSCAVAEPVVVVVAVVVVASIRAEVSIQRAISTRSIPVSTHVRTPILTPFVILPFPIFHCKFY